MSDQVELAGYVDIWWQAVDDFTGLLEELREEDWSAPTDLPGWDVKACAAHTAHLESVLAGEPEETADVGEPPHVTGLMGLYTEIGVVNRHTQAERMLRYQERWRWDPKAKRWWQMAGLPDFWEGK